MKKFMLFFALISFCPKFAFSYCEQEKRVMEKAEEACEYWTEHAKTGQWALPIIGYTGAYVSGAGAFNPGMLTGAANKGNLDWADRMCKFAEERAAYYQKCLRYHEWQSEKNAENELNEKAKLQGEAAATVVMDLFARKRAILQQKCENAQNDFTIDWMNCGNDLTDPQLQTELDEIAAKFFF